MCVLTRLENHYVDPVLARVYDITCAWDVDSDFYLSLANAESMKILDIGCGTGTLCNALAARNHRVIGLDPAVEMLRLARQKEYGGRVTWLEGRAQDFALQQQFDLIVMTGHAFQCLTGDNDVSALFGCVQQHLSESGQFVFESRNPAIDWVSRWQGSKIAYDTFSVSIEVGHRNDETLSFVQSFHFEDQCLISSCLLRFMQLQEIHNLLCESGLQCRKVSGGWDGDAFENDTSLEMIFHVENR